MILVFGGTSEGRKAAEVLEQAGKPFYYSTKTGEQELALKHGLRLDGALDESAMKLFCREHDIRLIVDAAHPFAERLHATVAMVAAALKLPLIRYERLYPKRDRSLEWVDSVEDIRWGDAPLRILSTLGVQSIARLKPYENADRHFLYRILPRESSITLARSLGATDEQLCFYHEGEDEQSVLQRLQPDVLLLKESGLSGGFLEKVEAAKALRIRVIAIRRPTLYSSPSTTHHSSPSTAHHSSLSTLHPTLVDGPHGLRRAVERLLPDFFTLKSGLTTGTCATAAAVAAWHRLLTGETPDEVAVRLPDGESIRVAVAYADDYAYCIKDAGDDPDVTDGAEVRASVVPSDHFLICGGEGVGRFTLPGFDYPPGEAAINRGPRRMLRENITGNYAVTISVRDGADIARRTFNPRLGIEGGISIIGVSGIVQPYSEEAFLESIRKCLCVAEASGAERVVLGSGAKSEDALKGFYPHLPAQAFVQYGNYVGATLTMADELGIRQLTLGMMLGKAAKLAAGQLDTHSRQGTFDRVFIAQLLTEAGIELDINTITLVRELWDLLPAERIEPFVKVVIDHCRRYCEPLFTKGELTLLLIDDKGCIYA